MKRATDTRDVVALGSPSKRMRAELPAATDHFADKLEVSASTLADTSLDETKYIVGQVFMLWPISKNTRKIQLSTAAGALDVMFEGTGVGKLDFVSKDKVKLSLKGARKEAKKSGSPHTLPFKLVFLGGAMVQLVASEKREEDKLVDLFKDAEDSNKTIEDDWYLPPKMDLVGEAFDASEYITNATTSDHLFESHHFQSPSMQTFESYSHPSTSVQHKPDNLPHDPVDSTHYEHYFGTSHPEIRCPTPPNTSIPFDLDQTTESSVSRVLPAPSPPILPNATSVQAPHKKEKRVKKRDLRHSRDSTESPTSDVIQNKASDLPDTNSKKPSGKNARKRQAALAKAQAESARAHPSPPPRDPALDLVAGLHSEKGGTYTPIAHVEVGKGYSLVGVVADVGAIKSTKTGDRSKTFILVDPSRYELQGLSVTIFVSDMDEKALPSANIGQVLLLRRIKIKEFQGRMQGTGYKDSFQWCGYDPAEGKHFYTEVESLTSTSKGISDFQPTHDAFFKPSASELDYFVKIADWWRALKEAEEKERSRIDHESFGNTTTHIVAPRMRGRRKLQTVAELEHGTFVDCVVELLKVWRDDMSSSIYVTDYSENKYLQDQTVTDEFPLGRRTLQISLWDEDNAIAEDLEAHSFYFLKNVRLKKQESCRLYLEGSMGYQERGIHKLGQSSAQENLQELIMRKKEYKENPHSSRLPPEEDESVPEPMLQGHTSLTRELSRVSANLSIVECMHMDQTRSTVEKVQQSNKCPNKFRIRTRITEYYPRRIEDFVTVACKSCHKILDGGYRLCPDCGDLSESSTNVKYQFALRVVDESQEELNISVSSDDANEFLSGLDARDARDDTAALKTRLAPLLGHLDKWHEEFDEEANGETGPWVDMCVSSWTPENGEESERIRLYKLFGCKLLNDSI